MKRRITISALIIAVILSLSACGDNKVTNDVPKTSEKNTEVVKTDADTSATGIYTMIYYEKDGAAVDISGKTSTIELKADGTGTFTVNGSPTEFTWDKNGCNINGSVSEYAVSGGTLTLTDGGVKMVFTKSGETQPAQADEPAETSADNGTAEPEPAVLDIAEPAGSEPVITLAEWENIEWDTYSDVYVSLKYPKGWTVENQSYGVELTYKVYDPENTARGWFFSEAEETAYRGQEWADHLQKENGLEDPPLVLANGTTQEYYEALWAQPKHNVTEFNVLESIYNGKSAAAQAVEGTNYGIHPTETDNSTIRAQWTQNGREGDGLYSCSLILYEMTAPLGDYSKYEQTGNGLDITFRDVDASHYKVYSRSWMTSERDELDNWLPVLQESMKSFTRTQKYWDDFHEYWRKVLGVDMMTTQQDSYSTAVSDTSDMLFDAWKRRETSEDIMQQKRSDAILGYERVYDTQTGDIYRANSGFMDAYDSLDGKRYAAVTDDMYTEGYKGYLDVELKKE